MVNSLERNINIATKKCQNEYYPGSKYNMFNEIYPFTTENISGYINYFDLLNKSLLTVGSSGDQVINAIMHGCKEITLLDINPYVKYYYYLKASAIICLSYDEYILFFKHNHYPDAFSYNKEAFNKELFNKLKDTLRIMDYESYLFWDELIQNFKGSKVRRKLFSNDESNTKIIKSCNPYLINQENYESTKDQIKKVFPTFIIEDLHEVNLQKKYDNIWLSNIAMYKKMQQVLSFVYQLDNNLNENGKLLISYLYRMKEDTQYKIEWPDIYDTNKVIQLLSKYHIELKTFKGVAGYLFDNDKMTDSIIIYTKK